MTRNRIPLVLGVAALVLGLAACGGGDDAADDALAVDSASAPAALDSPAAAPAPAPVAGALLDPEQATREQLLTVPNLDAALADAVVAGRPYANMMEVDSVLAASLSEEQRDAVYAVLWKPLDLNTASGAEILLIPGIGNRMQHEFEEYRPYTSIEQFRREMGKYVDDGEVARLVRYVTIR
ncbi:MAG TPA: hypothetical protein VEW03_10850 [Longimicrobiaceae bacterium]|nr:hypothetical protein [Longimicrobiaceae bacterium]